MQFGWIHVLTLVLQKFVNASGFFCCSWRAFSNVLVLFDWCTFFMYCLYVECCELRAYECKGKANPNSRFQETRDLGVHRISGMKSGNATKGEAKREGNGA